MGPFVQVRQIDGGVVARSLSSKGSGQALGLERHARSAKDSTQTAVGYAGSGGDAYAEAAAPGWTRPLS